MRKVIPRRIFETNIVKSDIFLIDKYISIIEECEKVIDHHIFIQNWVSNMILDSGDCWNISSICAHYIAYKSLTPHLFVIDGSNIAHLEVATEEDGLYQFWRVDPYNEIGDFKFRKTEPMAYEWWLFSYWLYLISVGNENIKFTQHGEVKDGFDVRQQIQHYFPNYPLPVKLLNLDLAKENF